MRYNVHREFEETAPILQRGCSVSDAPDLGSKSPTDDRSSKPCAALLKAQAQLEQLEVNG